MNNTEAIKQLESLKNHYKIYAEDGGEPWTDDVNDVNALDIAINELKKAPEVETQEQNLNKKYFNTLNEEIKKDLVNQRNLFEKACILFINKLDGKATNEEIDEFHNILHIQLPKISEATEIKMNNALSLINYLDWKTKFNKD